MLEQLEQLGQGMFLGLVGEYLLGHGSPYWLEIVVVQTPVILVTGFVLEEDISLLTSIIDVPGPESLQAVPFGLGQLFPLLLLLGLQLLYLLSDLLADLLGLSPFEELHLVLGSNQFHSLPHPAQESLRLLVGV